MKRKVLLLALTLVLFDEVGWPCDPTEGRGWTTPVPGIHFVIPRGN